MEINKFAERYIRVWNEPDTDQRRRDIAALWSEDGAHFTKSLEAHGHEDIEARIVKAYVGTGEFTFKVLDNSDGHHNVVKLKWEMMPTDGGKAKAAGSVFIILGDDGRIRFDYQFNEATA